MSIRNRIRSVGLVLVASVAVFGLSGLSGSASAATGTTVSTRTTSLGLIVVGAGHRTVYLLTKDTRNHSTCGAACRQTWPRVLTTGTPQAGPGIRQGKLGQTAAHQVTYYGHPLYYYVGDHRTAGRTNGQGLNQFGGRWWVVSPQGTAGTGTTITVHSTPDGMAVAGPTSRQRTLYLLTSDSATSSTCTATGSCASIWPALITTGRPHAGAGIDASLITTFVRSDGRRQVVYNGHPLYYFSYDTAVGQDNGECTYQGPGTWYISDASGHAVTNGSNANCSTGTVGPPTY